MASISQASFTGEKWFMLVSGGDVELDAMQNSIIELKTIFETLISKKLAKKERIILLNACDDNLLENENTIKLATPQVLLQILEGKYPISKENEPTFVTPIDTVVLFFAGHGRNPTNWSIIPPSASESSELGSWMFIPRDMDSLKLLTPALWRQADLKSRIVVFSLACYSGNLFRMALKGGENCVAICLASEDFPASFDHLMGQGIQTFFEKSKIKDAKLHDLCETLQSFMLEDEAIVAKKKENLCQSESEYEQERCESMQFAIGELEGYQPRKIPSVVWEIFREFDSLKQTIDENRVTEGCTQEFAGKLESHMEALEWKRFDLMRMYKHKPNNRIQYCGNVQLLSETKLSDLFEY